MSTLDETIYTEIKISVPWGQMAGRWYGDQTLRPILLTHGWLDNCGTFAKLAPLLTPYGSLLCIDLPGHGYSSHLPAGILYHNMEYVRAILRLMQAYNWNKVSLIGHSMGGAISFYFATLYPERVDMLVGIDIVKNRHFEAFLVPTLLAHIMDKALVDNERLLNVSSLNEPPSYTFEELERLLYEGSERSVELENCKYILERNIKKSQKYPEKYYFSRDGRMKYITESINPNDDFSEVMVSRISKIPIPFLVIKGGASNNISERSTAVISKLKLNNPNFEMHEIPGGTHHLHLNNPAPVAELIIPFLQKYRPLETVRAEQQTKRQINGKL